MPCRVPCSLCGHVASAVQLPSPSSSFRSSVGASPPRPISRRPSSQSISRVYSASGTPHSLNTQRPYRNSLAMSMSRSSAHLANMSSPYLRTSLLRGGSTHSLVAGNHLSPPVNISYAYAPPQMYNSGNPSPTPHARSSYISNSGYIWIIVGLLPGLVQPAPLFGIPEALWGVGAEPFHHGPSVTTAAAVPAAEAWRRFRREPEPGGHVVGPGLPAVLPEALRRLGREPVRHGFISAVTSGMLIMASQSSL